MARMIQSRRVPRTVAREMSTRVVALAVVTTDEMASRLLQASRDQLRGSPPRVVNTHKAAEEVGIDPYRMEYVRAVGYLLDYEYIELCPRSPLGLYKVTSKGLEKILKGEQGR